MRQALPVHIPAALRWGISSSWEPNTARPCTCSTWIADGAAHYPLMGCYGIGIGRLAASVCEAHHDEYGPIWPITIAPWQVHLCCMRSDNAEVHAMADALYDELQRAGVEVLL